MTTISSLRDPNSVEPASGAPERGPVRPVTAPVRVVLRAARDDAEQEREEEVELTLHHPAATVADLALALGPSPGWRASPVAAGDELSGRPDHIVVDGRHVPAGLPLRASGLRRGSTVVLGAGPAAELPPAAHPDGDGGGPMATARPRLRTVAGPDAGRELPLAAGLQVLGSGRGSDLRIEDPLLARHQAVVEVTDGGAVTITDLGAPRPSRVDGVVVDGSSPVVIGDHLTVGATSAILVDDDASSSGASLGRLRPGSGAPADPRAPTGRSRDSDRALPSEAVPGPQWTVAVHRPPRSPAPPPLVPVPLPADRGGREGSGTVGLAAVVATLAAGTLLAVVTRQPTFLLLSAVGAVGSIGAALWYRGRSRASRRADRRRSDADLARFADQLATHQQLAADRRRTGALELGEAVRIAGSGGSGLWARRADDADAYTAVVGRGEQVVPPALTGGRGGSDGASAAGGAWALVEAASVLPDVPVAVDLGPGEVVGIVGPPVLARSLLRSLVLQMVVAHGPAELLVAGVSGTDGSAGESAWLAWLPHTEDPASGERLVAAGPEVDAVLNGLDRAGSAGPQPHLLLVVEDSALLNARNTAARRVLAADPSAAALVLAPDVAALPGACRTVVQVRTDGSATIQRPERDDLSDHVVAAGASAATARKVALALAGFHDPERPAGGGGLAPMVALADLLAVPIDDAEQLRARWRAAGDDPPLRTLLAVAADGPVEVDLVRDGPHALVAGTTGSGKSELLRALVAGLAAGTGPERLAFVLVDYKGGAAFDACARLPHVVGMVTDLDDRLAERALRSLHAELRRREHVLREAGAPDLASYRAVRGRPPLPRLVVVVDEFATLAADLPGFIPSLVAVAQRGRSLGVHLVLATQRPAGAVSDDIRANTDLRIALRVQDPADAIDVVGDPAPAAIPRHRPGRAVIRFGPGELVSVQVASASAPVQRGDGQAVSIARLPVPVLPAVPGVPGVPEAAVSPEPSAATRPPALELLVTTIGRAASPTFAPQRPWLPPLPTEVALEDVPPGAVGLVDDPDHQAQGPWTWDRQRGHALCIGTVGSGTTTALASLALAAAAAAPPSDLQVYVVAGDPLLAALTALPHTGSVIGSGEDERQARLLRLLGARLTGGETGPARPSVLLVVDGLAAWRLDVAARLGPDLSDLLDRLLIEGPSAGVVVAAGLDRPGALPLALSGAVGERCLFRLADPTDATASGVRPAAVTGLPPGRAWLAGEGREVQFGWPRDVAAAAGEIGRRWANVGDDRRAPAIRTLPTSVAERDLPTVRTLPKRERDVRPWLLPLGVDAATLETAHLTLHAGDHLLVAGSARSGRTSALALLGRMAARIDPAARVVALAPRPAASRTLEAFEVCTTTDELSARLAAAAAGPLVVLVDDAELVDDPGEVVSSLLTGGANVLAAGRIDALRSAYGHWTQVLRRQRRGLLLRPESDLDGDLFGLGLPRWPVAPAATGRGYLVADGHGALVQLAAPDLTAGTRGD